MGDCVRHRLVADHGQSRFVSRGVLVCWLAKGEAIALPQGIEVRIATAGRGPVSTARSRCGWPAQDGPPAGSHLAHIDLRVGSQRPREEATNTTSPTLAWCTRHRGTPRSKRLAKLLTRSPAPHHRAIAIWDLLGGSLRSRRMSPPRSRPRPVGHGGRAHGLVPRAAGDQGAGRA
jgi:hypothetical protein